MSVTVINSTSPAFTCTSYETTLDAESIDTSYVYTTNYESSCGETDLTSTFSSGTSGTDGTDGEDGRGIVSITFLSDSDGNSTPGSPGTTDTYEILYTDDSTTTFNVTHGSNGVDGVDGADGNTITTGSGAPSGGSDGDLYIDIDTYDLYENQSGSWTIIGNIKGAKGDTGDTGPTGPSGSDGDSINWLADSSSHPSSPLELDAYYNTTDEKSYIYDGSSWQTLVEDGQEGDKWEKGSGAPSGTLSYNYNKYYLDVNTNEIYYKAEGSTNWTKITTLEGAKYYTTTNDTIDLSNVSVGNNKNITMNDSGMSYSVGQILVVANSDSDKFYGEITSYDDSDILPIRITKVVGTGSFSSWDINLSGVPTSENEETSGKVYEVELPAYDTTTQRVSNVTTDQYPDGWSLDDGSGGGVTQDNPDDLIIYHDITYSDGSYKPGVEVKIIYESTTDIWVTLTGDAAYTKLANDLSNGKIELASLTTENYKIKIHILFA